MDFLDRSELSSSSTLALPEEVMGTTPRLDEVMEMFVVSFTLIAFLVVDVAGDTAVLLLALRLLEEALGKAIVVPLRVGVLGGGASGTTPPEYDEPALLLLLLLELLAPDPNGLPRAALIVDLGFDVVLGLVGP